MNLSLKTTSKKRIELKELFPFRYYTKVLKSIMSSSLAFRRIYPTRRISSIYFDNSNYSAMEDSIEGNSLRSKKRIRWYGLEKQSVKASLEIKKKQGYVSWKRKYDSIYDINTRSKMWYGFLRCNDKDKEAYNLLNLDPKSIVTYDREYYGSFNKKIRITVDHNINYYHQHIKDYVNTNKGTKLENQIVVEIKLDHQDEDFLSKVLQDIPFTPRRFSKYCESVSSLNLYST